MESSRDKNVPISNVVAPIMAIAMEMESLIGIFVREQFDMPFADFKVLRAVFLLEDCTQLDIARFNQVTEAAVSKRVTALQQAKLLKKKVSAEDRRRTILTLTPKGSRSMARMHTEVIQKTEKILEDFSQKDRKTAQKLLVTLAHTIAQHSPNKNRLLQLQQPILHKNK